MQPTKVAVRALSTNTDTRRYNPTQRYKNKAALNLRSFLSSRVSPACITRRVAMINSTRLQNINTVAISIRLPLLCLSGLMLLSACSSDSTDDAAPVAQIEWEQCIDNADLDCATIDVPMDYNDADGELISIGLRRLEANNANTKRILLLNPGGPGGSGIDLINLFASNNPFPETVRNQFDIIGFDPRGVGQSTPVDCDEFGVADRDIYPSTDQDVRNLVDESIAAAQLCSEKHGDYLLHLGTRSVANDMNEIRIAAGVEELNFLGYSYGSRLGAVYLQEFPQHSGAIVLDAVLPPFSNTARLAIGQANAMQRNLDLLFTSCEQSDPPCDAQALKTALQQRADELVAAFNTEPLPADFDSPAALEFEAQLLINVLLTITTEFGLAEFALPPLIEYINTTNVDALASFTEFVQIVSQQDDDEDNFSDTATLAVQCADDAERPTFESLNSLRLELNATNDLFAEAILPLASICAGWPDAIEPLAPIAASVAPTALLIGGTTDAQTPIEWLEEMRPVIGAVSITSDHLGHTVVFSQQNPCVDEQVEAFLLTQTLPVNNNCTVEP